MPYIGYDPSAPGTISIQRYTAGTDFTAGSTTALTITYNPGSANNVSIFFDGIAQHHDQWSLSGTTITFNSAIPTGTLVVEIVYGKSVAINEPADASVTAAKMAVPVMQFSGRLTLASGTPIMTSDQTAKTTIYFTPYMGNQIPIYDGTRMVQTEFSELSQATTDATKSPAAVTTSSNYDLFVWNDSGTIRCTRGPAWSSDTARGTGAGTTELEMVKGVYTNKAAITNGPAANRGTYVGTVRSNGSSQIDWKLGSAAAGGGEAFLGVWNYYNRVAVHPVVQDSTDSWTYSTAAARSLNNSTTNRISAVVGVGEDRYTVTVRTQVSSGGASNPWVDIGLDSTTVGAADDFGGPIQGGFGPTHATKGGVVSGFHYWQALENISTGGVTCTYYGDNGGTGVAKEAFSGEFIA